MSPYCNSIMFTCIRYVQVIHFFIYTFIRHCLCMRARKTNGNWTGLIGRRWKEQVCFMFHAGKRWSDLNRGWLVAVLISTKAVKTMFWNAAVVNVKYRKTASLESGRRLTCLQSPGWSQRLSSPAFTTLWTITGQTGVGQQLVRSITKDGGTKVAESWSALILPSPSPMFPLAWPHLTQSQHLQNVS